MTDGSDASKAADSFHKWREDLALVKAFSLNTYRLSISWPRVLPQGTGQPSDEGLAYYRGILQECQRLGISPLVTLSHFDMPANLELEAGGWLNPDSVSWFLHFARTCFTELGDLVPRWITFNEPLVTAFQGYETGVWPPGLKEQPGQDLYLVARHILKSLKFGLVNVDFSSENRTRSPKLSSRYLANLAATNGFVPEQTPCV